MISIEEAYRALAQSLPSHPSSNREHGEIEATEGLSQVLAEPVSCRMDSPSFHQSAMDGVAFRYRSDRRRFRCVGAVAAGDPPGRFEPGPGECVRIMTGAPVPASTDTVTMIEKVTVEGEDILLQEEPRKGQHIRFRGENRKRGEQLFPRGTVMTPGVLAALLSQGIHRVSVVPPLRIGLASTGDELIDPHLPLKPGQIYNSNEPGLTALFRRLPAQVSSLGTLPDNLQKTRDCLSRHTSMDLLVLSGGVSMGAYDHIPEAARQAGFQQVFHKIKMKPGKPIWFGAHPNGALLFGLPGNPVSALVGALLFVQPMAWALLCGTFRPPVWTRAKISRTVANRGGMTLIIGVRPCNDSGEALIEPLQTSGSGDILRFGAFQGLAKIPPETTKEAGQEVEVLLPFPM